MSIKATRNFSFCILTVFLFTLSFLLVLLPPSSGVFACPSGEAIDPPSPPSLHRLVEFHQGASGSYVLEKGEEAFLARAWMVNNARESIDILTFIWSLDNIGMIATDALLEAADRGVRVRVVVDDMLLNEQPLDILLALAAHPLIDIRVYNPVMSVGVSTPRMILNLILHFRRFNHRMHNKTFMADRTVGICGGRNVANEYFDYDQKYNFRDRDILVAGPVVDQMRENFELYWSSDLAKPIESLVPGRMSALEGDDIRQIYRELDGCARRLVRQLPLVRSALENQEERFWRLVREMVWTKNVWFISDLPGKNLGKPGLGGGGEMARALTEAVACARERITIQSPYMVLPEGEMGLFEKRREGVEVFISTNSLASTDNIAAFSGYVKIRDELLDAGMVVREFRPYPDIEKELIERYLGPGKDMPVFVLHAKTMVIDGELLYIGTFNIDPRSANLNTEEGIFVRSPSLAREVERQIEEEMLPQNSWNPAEVNPNAYASPWRRIKLWFFILWPIRALL